MSEEVEAFVKRGWLTHEQVELLGKFFVDPRGNPIKYSAAEFRNLTKHLSYEDKSRLQAAVRFLKEPRWIILYREKEGRKPVVTGLELARFWAFRIKEYLARKRSMQYTKPS